jgi:hypothetical protein
MAKAKGELKLAEYRRGLEENLRTGQAGEQSHYSTLEKLLQTFRPDCQFLCVPNRSEVGAPDFLVLQERITVGYLEAKDIGSSLDQAEKSDQVKRYLGNLPVRNLILTNYREFRWYVDGEFRDSARVATVQQRDHVAILPTGREHLTALLQGFFAQEPAVLGRADDLAEWLARAAHEIREVVLRTYEQEGTGGALHQQLEALRQTLVPDLTPELFADTYAQTIAYGLFAARYEFETGKGFDRRRAAELLAHINPFLRDLFNNIAGPGLDPRVAWLVDNIAELLARADMSEVLQDFGREKEGEKDPVVHFYETFLKAYDPKLRERRGVYYTPRPVVSYIVRSIDSLLKSRFKLADGLADPSVLILDPACGTGTFLYEAIQLIHGRFADRNDLGRWPSYVGEKLLPRLFGFELLMAPYIICHLKLAVCLRETGRPLAPGESFNVFLNNALEPEVRPEHPAFAWLPGLALEGNKATEVKRRPDILVVLGNPPYSVSSYNKGEWIEGLMATYKRDVRAERNIQPLSDDYVKFIRFAHWRISERTGKGIVGMVTNHSYLSGLIHRGMRRRLLRAFDEVYVLDLHGNVKMKEVCPDGSKDENVFDIQQGVAISLYCKMAQREDTGPRLAKLRHADLWGLREAKYAHLRKQESEVSTTEWAALRPAQPNYWFVPKDVELQGEYAEGWSVADAFPVNSTGVKTHRDHFALDFDEAVLRSRIEAFIETSMSDKEAADSFNLHDTRDWRLADARAKIRADKDRFKKIIKYLYRPFDLRFLFWSQDAIELPRPGVMQHMLLPNVALCVGRQGQAVGPTEWRLCFCSELIDDVNLFRRGANLFAPLYFYEGHSRRANLAPKFVEQFAGKLAMRFVSEGKGDRRRSVGPEDLFDYIYAMLHSPRYRKRYADFLKTDFPRIPLTSNKELFRGLVRLGGELVALHLLEAEVFKDRRNFVTSFPVAGSDVVERVRYDTKNERVSINKEQYFEGVPKEVWEFQVGGYQVSEKWLKDRKGRALSDDDKTHYHKVILALSETIRLMSEIDAAIASWPIV